MRNSCTPIGINKGSGNPPSATTRLFQCVLPPSNSPEQTFRFLYGSCCGHDPQRNSMTCGYESQLSASAFLGLGACRCYKWVR